MLEPSNTFDNTLLTFAFDYNESFSLASNLSIAGSLSNDAAQSASIDPVETYINLLPPSKPQVTLTIAKKAQYIWSIAMLMDNQEEIECIVDSRSQIISMILMMLNPHKTTLTITDPNSGLCHTIPTFPRGHIRQPRTKVQYEEEPPGHFWHRLHHHHR